MKTILLGITSGIAAYKILDLIPLLKNENINIEIIMTSSAAKMIPAEKFEKINKKKAHIELFEKDFDYRQILEKKEVEHVSLADKCDLVCIAPATANTIAKLAHGLADDLLTTTVLATTKPVLIFPSMNSNMWTNPATSDNVKILIKRGYIIINPDSGPLACATVGPGRLPEVVKIKNQILKILNKKNLLKHKKILITSGGTEEELDDVRVITNKSSGKMGAALADQCYLYGAEVTILRAKKSQSSKYPVKELLFQTSEELENQMKKIIPVSDICFHTAAVSDFVPNKIKGKISSKKTLTLKLKPQRKIISYIKKWNPKIKLIAFKAHYGSNTQNLLLDISKLSKDAKADFIVANDISKKNNGIGSNFNSVKIINQNHRIFNIKKDIKSKIAQQLINYILDL